MMNAGTPINSGAATPISGTGVLSTTPFTFNKTVQTVSSDVGSGVCLVTTRMLSVTLICAELLFVNPILLSRSSACACLPCCRRSLHRCRPHSL